MSDTIITSKLDGNLLIVETSDGTTTYDSKFLVVPKRFATKSTKISWSYRYCAPG